MSEEIIKLQLRKVKLLQAIEDTKQKKEKIISVVQDFVKQLNSGRITRKEYEEKLNSVLNKRTAEQWIKYYDDYIKYYEYQVKLCDKLIAGEKKKEKLEKNRKETKASKTNVFDSHQKSKISEISLTSQPSLIKEKKQ
jgi:flagellar biosynthesis chaperone FliJ